MSKGDILRDVQNPKDKYLVRRAFVIKVGVRKINKKGILEEYQIFLKSDFEILATDR